MISKDADSVKEEPFYEQMISSPDCKRGRRNFPGTKAAGKGNPRKEKHFTEAMLSVKSKYGKNAILKAADLQEGAATRQKFVRLADIRHNPTTKSDNREKE